MQSRRGTCQVSCDKTRNVYDYQTARLSRPECTMGCTVRKRSRRAAASLEIRPFRRESKCFSIGNPCSIPTFVEIDPIEDELVLHRSCLLIEREQRVFSHRGNSLALLPIAIAIPSVQDALVLLSDRRDHTCTCVHTYVETRRSFSILGFSLPGNFFEEACGR